MHFYNLLMQLRQESLEDYVGVRTTATRNTKARAPNFVLRCTYFVTEECRALGS